MSSNGYHKAAAGARAGQWVRCYAKVCTLTHASTVQSIPAAERPSGERQKHGFNYENQVVNSLNLIKEKNYTAPADAFTQDGVPVNIKSVQKGGEVCLGDYNRLANASQDFYMVVGVYEEKGKIDEQIILKIPADKWKEHFVNPHFAQMKTLLDSVSNDSSDDEHWKQQREIIQKSYENVRASSGSFIRMRPKRDSKKQKRIQCAISVEDLRKLADKWTTTDLNI